MKVQPTRLAKSLQQVTPDVNVFARLMKVDTQNRIVYGRAVQEVPDATGEIFDYKSSKPHFEKWVSETKEATAGKSLGNIRAMHGATAAGKIVEIVFHDDERAIDVAAKIVDDQEWAKVQEGVYTGFSIGGSYVGKKTKDGDLMRYTAAPIELSLVDKPCIPTAMFYDVVKAKGFQVIDADGKESKHEFKLEVEAPVTKTIAVDPDADNEVELDATKADLIALSKVLTDNKLTLAKAIDAVKASIVVEVPKRFADVANKKYPLDNGPQILAAWYFVNTGEATKLYEPEQLETIKAAVKAAFAEKFEGKEPEALDAAKALSLLTSEQTLEKSFYSAASAAGVLQSLSYFAEDMRYYEIQDDAPAGLVGKVAVCIQAMSSIISDLIVHAASQVDKALIEPNQKAIFEAGEALRKAMSDMDEKKMKKRLQKAHDMVVEAGAVCQTQKGLEGDDLTKAAHTGDMQKMIDDLRKEVDVLKTAPRPSKVVVRAIAKGEDTGVDEPPEGSMEALLKSIEPVLGSDGKVDAAATFIKLQHRMAHQPQG